MNRATELLERLEKLASSATPGPWFNDTYDRTIRNYNYEKKIGRAFHIARYPHRASDYPISHDEWRGNAAFIAALNPLTAKKLIAALREATTYIESQCGWSVTRTQYAKEALARIEAILTGDEK